MVEILVDYSFPCIIGRVTMYTCLYPCTLSHIGYIMKVTPSLGFVVFPLILSFYISIGSDAPPPPPPSGPLDPAPPPLSHPSPSLYPQSTFTPTISSLLELGVSVKPIVFHHQACPHLVCSSPHLYPPSPPPPHLSPSPPLPRHPWRRIWRPYGDGRRLHAFLPLSEFYIRQPP
jgi:hypothetical protein